MIPEIRIPSAHLRPFIKQFWFLNCKVEGSYIQRVIPSGMAELTLYLGSVPKVTGFIGSFDDRFLLTGHSNSYYDLHISGELSLFSITFRPEGLMAFFRVPASELFNTCLSLQAVHPRLANELITRLEDAADTDARVAAAEQVFTDLLRLEINKYEYSRIRHVVEIIKATRGQTGIEWLASESCLSRKQFERKFNEHIGITPKQYLKTIRLQSALHRKGNDPDLSVVALACDCGYFDQAHLIHDFKTLTGLTPRQYFDTCQPFSDFFG